MPSQNDTVPDGQANPASYWGEYNQISFAIQQAIARVQTTTIVKIVSCTNSGGVSPVGFVDVVPMVHQVDSAGIGVPHTTIFNVPYCRVQGGSNAVIIDPEPGDVGICCFASRDLTKVKASKEAGNPGSLRKYDFADGLYIGGVLNAAPTQYVQFSSAGVNITSPNKVNITAPVVEINASTSTTINTPQFIVNGLSTFNGLTTVNADLAINGGITQGVGGSGGASTLIGPLTVTNDVTAAGKSLSTHAHSGVTTGGGNSGPPV